MSCCITGIGPRCCGEVGVSEMDALGRPSFVDYEVTLPMFDENVERKIHAPGRHVTLLVCGKCLC